MSKILAPTSSPPGGERREARKLPPVPPPWEGVRGRPFSSLSLGEG